MRKLSQNAKRVAIVGTAVGTIVTGGALAASTAFASVNWPVLKVGAKGQTVAVAQYLLRCHGESINADGRYGQGTAATVKNYQRKNRLGADGITGRRTWESMTNRAPVKRGSTGPCVKAAQTDLVSKGYLKQSQVDGSFGAATDAAVRKFQKDYRIKVTGVMTPSTWLSATAGE